MSTRIHTNQLLNEIMRIFDQDLRVSLGLSAVIKGDITWMPTAGIQNLANGIFISVDPNIQIARVQLPTDLQVTYNFRILYVKKIVVGQNVEEQKINDIETIIDKVFDKFTLPDLTLTGGQVLWWLPETVETEPPEDAYVSQLASDLVAIAFRTSCVVRTRR